MGGSAALRAECLRLSVQPSKSKRLCLGRRSRTLEDSVAGKPEAFRTDSGQATVKEPQSTIRSEQAEVVTTSRSTS